MLLTYKKEATSIWTCSHATERPRQSRNVCGDLISLAVVKFLAVLAGFAIYYLEIVFSESESELSAMHLALGSESFWDCAQSIPGTRNAGEAHFEAFPSNPTTNKVIRAIRSF